MAASNLIQPISSGSGIYFDYLGKLRITNGHLNVLMPIDVSHFQPHITNINAMLGSVRFLCSQKYNSGCHNLLEPLTVRYKDIEKQFDSISHLVDSRIKRGAWFGGVGTVFKHIFGTLDENDALRYDDAINAVQSDTKKLASLMKENILVTTSTIAAYNNSIYKLKINEDSLNHAIDNLSVKINNLTLISNNLLTSINFISIFNSLETSLLTLSFHLEDIINAILLSNLNVLHPSIITPHQLYRELAENIRHLPNKLELPLKIDVNSIHTILNVSTTACYYLNHKIVFVLQIPLVTSIEFYLYHNIPLPVPHDSEKPNSFSLIVPSSKYIAITKDKAHYSSINSLSTCKNVNSGTYICAIIALYSSSANPSCESEIISKVLSVLPVQCETRFIHGKLDLWTPLTNNQWIFVQTSPTKLSLDCVSSELLEEIIIGTGILKVPKYCSVYCKSTQLFSNDNVYNISSPVSSFSNFNLINDSCCNLNKFKANINNVPPIDLRNIDLENVNYNTVTKSLVKDLNRIIEEPHVIKYGAHYSVLTVFIILIVICIIMYKFYVQIYIRNSNSFPITTTPVSNDTIVEFQTNRQTDHLETNNTISEETPQQNPMPKLRINI